MIPNLIDAVKIVEYQLRHKIHPCIENPGAKLKKKTWLRTTRYYNYSIPLRMRKN